MAADKLGRRDAGWWGWVEGEENGMVVEKENKSGAGSGRGLAEG